MRPQAGQRPVVPHTGAWIEIITQIDPHQTLTNDSGLDTLRLGKILIQIYREEVRL